MAKYKHLDQTPDTLQQFIAQIPSLISNFRSLTIEETRRKETEETRKIERNEDIARRTKWREEDKAAKLKEKKENVFITKAEAHSTYLKQLRISKIEEYNVDLDAYEKLGMSVDASDKINQTKGMEQLITLFTDPNNVDLSENALIAKEIKILESLISDVDSRKKKIEGRLTFADNFNKEINKRENFFEKGPEDEFESMTGIQYWTQGDMDMLISDILKDEVFKEENGVHANSNGEWKEYASEYIEVIQNPSDAKLRAMNGEIIKYQADKNKAMIDNVDFELEMLVKQQALDPEVVQAQMVNTMTKVLDSYDASIPYLPGMAEGYKDLIIAHEKYSEDIGIIKQQTQDADYVDALFDEANKAFKLTNDGKLDKSKWNKEAAFNYLEWKAQAKFHSSSVLASMIGTREADRIFSMDKMTYSSFLTSVVESVTQLNNYAENSQTPSGENWLQSMQSRHGSNLGKSQFLQLMQDELQVYIGTDKFGQDIDMMDSDIIQLYFKMQDYEKKLEDFIISRPKGYDELKEVIGQSSVFDINNETSTSALSASISCGEGLIYDETTGLCLQNLNETWLGSNALAAALPDKVKYRGAGGAWLEPGSRGSSTKYPGSDRGVPDRRPEQ